MDLEHITIALLSLIGSLVGAGAVSLVAIRKLKPEIRGMDAVASTSWATSNEMAARQLVLLQQQLMVQADLRKGDAIRMAEFEIKLEIQDRKISRLEAQIKSLGQEPVK